MYLLFEAICLVLVLQTIAFGLSIYTDKNSIADVFWGFSIASGALWIIWPLLSVVLKTPQLIPFISSLVIGLLTALWGLRLTFHIGKRFLKKKKEDVRYERMSAHWQRFYLRSYLQVFLFQGLLILAMLSPVLATTFNSGTPNFYFLAVGASVWLFGLIFEIIADAQLAKFIKTKQPGQIMQSGLWRYSRHPNYFGEVTLWWGLFIISLSSPLWYVSLIAPVLITFLILKVSGVPMAEARYKDNQDFQTYAKKTNAFWPWFPKK